MSTDQVLLFTLLAVVFVLLIWGRWRYDLVAFCSLLVAVALGLVPATGAFAGFGHPAVVIIALVLVVSRGLSNSGAIELLARKVVSGSRSLAGHIGVMSGVGAALSALMNNVATLALLMPVDLQAAARAGRSPALSLMPLSFATILGGMITLIGTPPNIVIAEFRNDVLGEPFQMFDFAPVGLAVAAVGVLFVSLVGWRLLPADRQGSDGDGARFELADYLVELEVKAGSKIVGQRVSDLDSAAMEAGVNVLGLIRRGKRLPGRARREEIRAGDLLVVEAHPEQVEELQGALGLEYVGTARGALEEEELVLQEAVVPENSRFAGRTARSLKLLYRHRVLLVGVSRGGKRFREGVRKLTIQPGDVLLLLGSPEQLGDITARLGLLPLASRGQRVIQRRKAWLAVSLFGAAILVASLGWLYLPVALGFVAVAYVGLNIVPLREVYDAIEWPVIVLLGSMIPLGAALQNTGGTELIAAVIIDLTSGQSAAMVLLLLVVATMTLSDVMNNTATAVIMAPIAVEIAARLGAEPDPFLMGVAVAASCAFLTPIGHKNNTLIMGPGGYRFGDYWRMGLPLEILVILVGVPMILWVWPLYG